MSLSDLRLEEESLLPVTKEIREKIIERTEKKGITISSLLEQLLNERKEKDAALHRRNFKVEKLREYDFKFRESPAFKS